jgi:hypothetical protein
MQGLHERANEKRGEKSLHGFRVFGLGGLIERPYPWQAYRILVDNPADAARRISAICR